MWQSALLLCILGFTISGAEAQGSPSLCWVRSTSLSDTGEAIVKFDPAARGFMGITSPGVQQPDTTFYLVPENGNKNGSNSTVRIPKDKEAWLRQGHEGCEFRWAQEGASSGIRISATSSYVPQGAAPTTAHAFIPFSKK